MLKQFQNSHSVKCLLWAIVCSLIVPFPVARAAGTSSTDPLEQKGPQQTAEFIFRNSARDNLITIQVFGSVARPGIYYVPEDTDLMKLLTLAGGVLNNTELDEVIVRKNDIRGWAALDSQFIEPINAHTYSVNVDKLLKRTVTLKPMKMNHEDFVYIPMKEPFISNDLSKIITIGSVLLTGVLTFVLIRKNNK
jgi:competence protein ComEA